MTDPMTSVESRYLYNFSYAESHEPLRFPYTDARGKLYYDCQDRTFGFDTTAKNIVGQVVPSGHVVHRIRIATDGKLTTAIATQVIRSEQIKIDAKMTGPIAAAKQVKLELNLFGHGMVVWTVDSAGFDAAQCNF